MHLHTQILKRSQYLDSQITIIQQKLKSLPEGTLVCSHQKNRSRWFIRHDNTLTYIPKTNRSLAEQLAYKRYLTTQLSRYQKEKSALDAYLKRYTPQNNNPHKLYQELLAPAFQPQSEDLQDWMNTPYERNKLHPEHLVHRTISGHLVRSKSEALIAHVLSTNHIPFRYECALSLGSNTFFPDFTIKHPQTFNLIYWEHFGMMDEPVYIQKTYSKLQIYTLNQIIPGVNLITTFETRENPLTIDNIIQIVSYHFL